MNILMVVFNTVETGTYFRAYAFARSLVRFGHTVTLMATSRSSKFHISDRISEGIKVIETPDMFTGPLRSGWDPFNVLSRINFVKKQRYDIVHAFESRPVVLVPALWLRNRGVPLIMDWCDWFGKGGSVEERPNAIVRTMLRPVETYFEEHFRDRACATTVICKTLMERAKSLGVKPETVEIIPNGFDTPGWKVYTRADARRQLGFGNDEILIGYVGSLFRQDARLMAEAFNLIVDHLPGCRLVHAGSSRFSTKPWINQPERLIETGRVDQATLSRYLAACDVCWLPFRNTIANRGRFPMKFSNYLAAGKAVVATDVGDVSVYIKESGSGYVVKDEAKALANTVEMVLGDSQRMKRMEEASKNLAKNPAYSWETRTKQVESVYLRVITRKAE
jgi:glycosyltransferase involved in cell wall biosynthesis